MKTCPFFQRLLEAFKINLHTYMNPSAFTFNRVCNVPYSVLKCLEVCVLFCLFESRMLGLIQCSHGTRLDKTKACTQKNISANKNWLKLPIVPKFVN